MKKVFVFLSLLVLISLACNALVPATATQAPPATSIPDASDSPPPSTGNEVDMAAKLAELGGSTCEEQPDLTCVTIQMPLNHFDSANTETIGVVFGVAPATGERYGMYVQAFPGGPGGEGISSAYMGYFDEGILEHYDVVYYDQRGLGLSNPLECPITYAEDFKEYLTGYDTAGEEGLDTPEEQQDAIEDARKYAEDCIAEIGIDPASLAFFGTDQVAEDIDAFREIIGDEKIWIYGVSYGTAVAQTYGEAHPDRLAGVILDGTINMTQTGEQSSFSQEKAFDKVLVAVLNACTEDEDCRADMGGEDALAVYDELAAKISKDPIEYEFPLPNNEKVSGVFTFAAFEYTTAYQMYSLTGRMIYLKALAAANKGDMIPMLRLMYENATIDPATNEYLGDPTFSDTMFLSVLCTDDTFFSGTQEERIAQTIEAGQASNGTVPRIDGFVYTGIDCAFWPSSPTEVVKREPLKLEGVPVLVLNATLDPATPFEEGKFVAENLADGYHIYVEGGVHSIYGYGYSCPDQYVTDFLVDGTLPEQREILCTDWEDPIFGFYVPNLPDSVNDFEDPLTMMFAFDDNFYYLPDTYYYDWSEEKSIGCTYGGTHTFAPSDAGEQHTYDQCAMMPGLILTGEGSFDYNTGVFSMNVEISGDKSGNLQYAYDYSQGTATLTGEFDGETIDMSQ
ncbi:MAG: alpha/beta fold hydrolase [Anaerolineales bacterium]|nr:alpha/beta fold hydrolase [Anaerolineales bacterium]